MDRRFNNARGGSEWGALRGRHADRETLRDAARRGGRVVHSFSKAEELREHCDRDSALAAVARGEWAALRGRRNDRDFMLQAVGRNGYALQHASEALRADEDLVMEAVRSQPLAFRYAAQELRSTWDVVLEVVKLQGRALRFVPQEFREDPEIVLAAVEQDGAALELADLRFRSDFAIVLAAVKSNGCALRLADEWLRRSREIVLAAVRQQGSALQHAPQEMREDREVSSEALRSDPQGAFPFVLHNGVVEEAVARDPNLAALNRRFRRRAQEDSDDAALGFLTDVPQAGSGSGMAFPICSHFDGLKDMRAHSAGSIIARVKGQELDDGALSGFLAGAPAGPLHADRWK